MTVSDLIRKAAIWQAEVFDLSEAFGYFTEAWVIIKARLPHEMPMVHWALATDDERRMFLLMVAEALERA